MNKSLLVRSYDLRDFHIGIYKDFQFGNGLAILALFGDISHSDEDYINA